MKFSSLLALVLAALLSLLTGCSDVVQPDPPLGPAFNHAAAGGAALFVDRNSTAEREDGTASAPFRTITRALDHARRLRFGSSAAGVSPSVNTIIVHIAPSAAPYVGSFDPAVFDAASPLYDPSKEMLPLMLNIPRLDLRGGTRLLEDADGLPSTVVPETVTMLRADQPQGGRQYLVMVTRTNPVPGSEFPESLEMAGDDVTITGLWLEADPAPQIPSAFIGVDAVTDFVVRGNVLASGANGIFTRLASGRIEGNLALNNVVAFFLTGGSSRLPGILTVRGNRVTGQRAAGGGLYLMGAGETGNRRRDLDFGANRFRRVMLPAVYDPLASPGEVPDKLQVDVIHNEFSNSQNGVRVVGYVQDPYSAAPGQDETANIRASFRDNVVSSNQHYGLVADAAQIPLGDRRRVSMDLSFAGTTMDGNGFGPAIFTFWRYAGSISLGSPTPFLQPNPVFAHDSTIRICGDVTVFHYDNRQDPHPPTNPAPTNNRLLVNNVELDGFQVSAFFEVPATSPRCGSP